MTVEMRSYKMKEIQGDMMTPISIYRSLNGKKKMLFESSAKHQESGSRTKPFTSLLMRTEAF